MSRLKAKSKAVFKKPHFVFLMCLFLLVMSCDLLRDSPYEVSAWTPGEGFHQDPSAIKVSLLLSHDSDRVKTEQAFSFTEDRKTLKGSFLWEATKLIFIPAAPLESGRDYTVSLGTSAQDTKGISLERRFEASFTTRLPGEKLRIIGTVPDHGGSLSGSRGEFRVFFSDAVSLRLSLNRLFMPRRK